MTATLLAPYSTHRAQLNGNKRGISSYSQSPNRKTNLGTNILPAAVAPGITETTRPFRSITGSGPIVAFDKKYAYVLPKTLFDKQIPENFPIGAIIHMYLIRSSRFPPHYTLHSLTTNTGQHSQTTHNFPLHLSHLHHPVHPTYIH